MGAFTFNQSTNSWDYDANAPSLPPYPYVESTHFTTDDGSRYARADPSAFESYDRIDSRFMIVPRAVASTTIYSQNGYSADDRSVIASYSLPGGSISLRKGDVSVVLLWCLNQWHQHVEPLKWPGNWGYAERLIIGSSTVVSNHASGTAADADAPEHPIGTDPTSNFMTEQIAAIHAIVAFCEGVIRWGGDYVGRKDGMHLEINAGVAEVTRIASKIRNGGVAAPVVTSRKDNMIDNRELGPGSGDIRLIVPVGKASITTARAWLSATVNGPDLGSVRGWFQSDTGGISDFSWTIGYADGHSNRPWTEMPDGTTQVNLQYDMPDGGTICVETLAK